MANGSLSANNQQLTCKQPTIHLQKKSAVKKQVRLNKDASKGRMF